MKGTTAYWPVPLFGQGTSEGKTSQLSTQLSRLWHGILAHLDVSDEPHVWPSYTNGQKTWNAYDPVTAQSVHLVSEADLRTWLEELHYQDERAVRHYKEQLRFMGNN